MKLEELSNRSASGEWGGRGGGNGGEGSTLHASAPSSSSSSSASSASLPSSSSARPSGPRVQWRVDLLLDELLGLGSWVVLQTGLWPGRPFPSLHAPAPSSSSRLVPLAVAQLLLLLCRAEVAQAQVGPPVGLGGPPVGLEGATSAQVKAARFMLHASAPSSSSRLVPLAVAQLLLLLLTWATWVL